jgi:hypothetical protein
MYRLGRYEQSKAKQMFIRLIIIYPIIICL